PLVDLLVRVRVPRGLACFLAVLALVAVLGFIGTLFAIGFARQLDTLRADVAGAIDGLRSWLVSGPLPVDEAQVDRIAADVGEQFRRIGPQLTRGAANVIEAVALGLLTLVLLFFLLRDGRAMTRWLLGGLPERNQVCGERAALA